LSRDSTIIAVALSHFSRISLPPFPTSQTVDDLLPLRLVLGLTEDALVEQLLDLGKPLLRAASTPQLSNVPAGGAGEG
jgi:hypothetical protein